MKFSVGLGRENAEKRLEDRGVTRRDFMKFCASVAAAMGMGPAFAPKVAQALTAAKRPSVVWLHNAECTGCSEAILRTVKPFIDELILDTISLDYHETIMAAAGEAAEEALHKAVAAPDGFFLVVEGGIPMIENGAWGKVSGKTMLETTKELAPKAKGVICMGTCSCFGGVQKAKPNPSQAVSVKEATGVTTINIAGCPPNPINFVGAVVHVLTKGIPELDKDGRPNMFFGETVHDNCPRLKHFDASEFAPSFDSEEAKKGYCLYELGCKGPVTYNNCPKVLFNQTNWPVQAGHPCIGCSEPDFWDSMSPFYQQ
ncbi:MULTISPECIES: hydrogenase small subunit [Desulfolutivibrio]|jgi:[NiFe] hydrogenase small subunit|uniref:cytochrome-c3 hydrogenase n=1 Tax=Desulfolutivibrio sulfodismutans TaxID=63561 RepID=A0A7K3NRF0_9BACT|nr:hydrogenase small subunit [Desulfolutivibrio sulfodismutans]NDY58731.1 hydrogenase small subunit [Desulfolutivibrio sulfodismutans]QLA14141.1 hydrogenase small subunit [Desulfolutivibrio sulfodismutans DSM 3696]